MNPIIERISGFFIGFIMFFTVNLLVIKSYYFEVPFANILVLNLCIWVSSYLITNILVQIKYILALIGIIIGSIALAFIPNWILISLRLTHPNIYQSINIIFKLIKPEKIKAFFLWVYNYILGYSHNIISDNFEIILLGITFTLIGLIFSYLLVNRKRTIIYMIPLLYFINEWFRYIDEVMKYINFYFIGLILHYIFTNYRAKLEKAKIDKAKYQNYTYRHTVFYGVAIALIIIFVSNFILFLFPLDTINEKVASFIPSSSKYRNEYSGKNKSEKFSFYSTPYQPIRGKLGGPVELNKDLLMLVKSEKSVYLRGRVKNIYKNSNWFGNKGSFYKSKGDIVGTDNLLGEDNDSEIIEIRVYPKNIETNTIFTPLKPVGIEISGKKIYYNKDLEIYYKNRFFKTAVDSYEVKSVLSKNEYKRNEMDKVEEINESHYLMIPDSITERTKQLTYDITSGVDTDYDKIKSLESYLKDFKYNLSVPEVPENKDFIDYFLFEGKEGYCTYYASALAIMGRIVGVPTRYVEGFVLPKEMNKDGLFEVTADRAHAWVEAYIDGIGWMRFEPTSAYNSLNTTETVESEEVSDVVSENGNNLMIEDQNLEDLLYENFDDDYPVGNFNGLSKQGREVNVFRIVIAILLLLLVTRFVYLLYLSKKRFKMIDNRDKIQRYFYSIISIYTSIYKVDSVNYDVEKIVQLIYDEIFMKQADYEVINTINKALYSNEGIYDSDVQLIVGIYEDVEKKVMNRMGKIKYLFCKYFIGSFYERE